VGWTLWVILKPLSCFVFAFSFHKQLSSPFFFFFILPVRPCQGAERHGETGKKRREKKKNKTKEKREAGLHLVTSKTVLICSETLQGKKVMVEGARLEKYQH
jgi:hypothetical protein